LIAGSILVSDGELRALARGIVPLRVRAQALELSQSLMVKLLQNAARPERKRMAKAAGRKARSWQTT
jgi:hypothetical protein